MWAWSSAGICPHWHLSRTRRRCINVRAATPYRGVRLAGSGRWASATGVLERLARNGPSHRTRTPVVCRGVAAARIRRTVRTTHDHRHLRLWSTFMEGFHSAVRVSPGAASSIARPSVERALKQRGLALANEYPAWGVVDQMGSARRGVVIDEPGCAESRLCLPCERAAEPHRMTSPTRRMDGFSPTQSENQGVISGVAQQGPTASSISAIASNNN